MSTSNIKICKKVRWAWPNFFEDLFKDYAFEKDFEG